MLPSRFDYLFIARFRNGDECRQTQADASLAHPLTRSAFWDVLQRHADVETFTLVDRHAQHEHTVFLADGHFKTDGEIIPCPRPDLRDFRVLYFRRCQQVWEGGILSYPRIVAYFIGWQANDADGNGFEMSLQIPPLGLGPATLHRKG